MHQSVKITPFNVLNNDLRGVTATFSIPRTQADFIYLTRKAGSISGNTYHEGTVSATAPKIIILLSGGIIFSYRKVNTDKVIKEVVETPSIIEISPYIVHNVETLTDSVFLECNSIQDIQNDKIKENVQV